MPTAFLGCAGFGFSTGKVAGMRGVEFDEWKVGTLVTLNNPSA